VAEKARMSLRLLEDIRDQPDSLRSVLRYQAGEGRAALEAAADAMKAAENLIVTGMGASLFAAMPLAYEWPRCRIIETSDLLHYRPEVCRGATVVVVSRSGESVEAVKLLPVLRRLGAKVIGVTNEPASTLAQSSDITVLVNSGRDEMVALQSYTGTMLALLLLAAPDDEANAAIARVGETIAACETADAFPLGRTVYVLGRGPSLASAQEGALLFHETAKFPAIPMEAGSFRHGPLEVVDPDFRGIVFAAQPATLHLDLHLIDDLRALGGQVEAIAVQDVPQRFVPMVEIVPVQFFAMRLAQSRGIRPGEFRYVTQVTQSETGFSLRPRN
jgi:glucosamine--fructose-6-phosphate aminotransferase (isomerizing)